MTTKILQKLRPLDFPECSKQAINYLVSCFSSDDHGSLPGLSGAPENLAQDVARDYILFTSQNQRGHRVSCTNIYNSVLLSSWSHDNAWHLIYLWWNLFLIILVNFSLLQKFSFFDLLKESLYNYNPEAN